MVNKWMVTCLLHCSNGWNVFTSQKIIVCPYHSDILPISWVESGAGTVFTRMSYYIYVQGRHHFKDSMKFIGMSWTHLHVFSEIPSWGLYDKFSERERTSGALASNVSHANGTASRVGAFEVHLLQDVWNAKRPGEHDGRKWIMVGYIYKYIYILFVHEKCDII